MEETYYHCYSEMIPLTSFIETPLLQQCEQVEPVLQEVGVSGQVNRIKRIFDANHKLTRKKQSYKVELELSIILLREMKSDPQLHTIMMVSIIVDCIIRLNNYIYLIMLLSQGNETGIVLLIYLLLIPRLYFQLSLIKMLFRKLHLYRNQPILMIIIPFRQNFTQKNMSEEATKEWYDWRDETSNFDTQQLIVYLTLPNELTYFQLKNKKNGIQTYIVTSFILKTIEVVMFIPVMLILLNFNEYLFNTKYSRSNGYEQFTLVLVYIDGIKYIFISVFYLTKRNYQINKY